MPSRFDIMRGLKDVFKNDADREAASPSTMDEEMFRRFLKTDVDLAWWEAQFESQRKWLIKATELGSIQNWGIFSEYYQGHLIDTVEARMIRKFTSVSLYSVARAPGKESFES
jgi:hypothetical protein